MKTAAPYNLIKRPDTGKWQVSLSPTCGLPADVCSQWKRKSFEKLPDELHKYRIPTSEAKAKVSAQALIDYLRRELERRASRPADEPDDVSHPTVGEWIQRFLAADTSPRAARLVAQNRPYSPDTLELYSGIYKVHLAQDDLMHLPIFLVQQGDVLSFMSRLATHPVKEGRRPVKGEIRGPKIERTLGGTRTFEIVFSFVRMTFKEFGKQRPGWVDPFNSIDRPKPLQTGRREALEEAEVVKLFAPGVLEDEMDLAVCAAMFWAGLRRSEIFGLLTTDLDWETPRICVNHAWKQFDDEENRVLLDPKCHKVRQAPFPDILQEAIKALWKKNGEHRFVFSNKDGTLPNARWFSYRVGVWFKKAGINLDGRKITPHSARHSLASILEDQGESIRLIGELLGHSDLKTTKGYIHTTGAAINRIAAKIKKASGGEAKEAGQ